jgi:hypothetical protein
MNECKSNLLSAIAALMTVAGASASIAGTLSFSGYTWAIRNNGYGGPGPNHWDRDNAWVDANGCLHLRLTHRNNQWYGAEVQTQQKLGHGRYQFWLEGRIDKLDPNVVLGLFNYPTPDVGPDGTHEIDIEFAQWGNPYAPRGNYTVWPASPGLRQETKPFSFVLKSDSSLHCLAWSPTAVRFESFHGRAGATNELFAHWLFQPTNPASFISQMPMPVHINLWCFKGRPPSNGQPVEWIIRAFKFTPR